MLSSRYLHLHEALGLGPMWLKQGATIRPVAAHPQATTAPAAPIAVSPPASAPAHPTATATPEPSRTARPSEAVHPARAAAMAAAGSSVGGYFKSREREAARLHTPATLGTQHTTSNAAPVFHSSNIAPASLVVISICPSPEDQALGQLFNGQVGLLLDNMLAAIGLSPQQVYKTSWLHDAALISNPPPEQLAAALPRLQAELQQAAPQAVLLLGQFFEQAEQAETLHTLCGSLPLFTVPHPARLLRQPQLKARAWAVLKQLKQQLSAKAV